MKNLLLIIAIGLLTMACSSQKNLTSQLSEDVKWKVKSINNEELNENEFRVPPFIKFNISKSNIGGQLGCNSFGASYQINNSKITFGAVASTKMACPQLDFENKFGKLLSLQSYTIAIKKDILTLTDKTNTITFIKADN